MGRLKKASREEISERRKRIAERSAAADLPFPECVRDMRHAIGFTQAEFAKMVKLTVRQLAEIEVGSANPTFQTLARIASVFGYRVGFIPKSSKTVPRRVAASAAVIPDAGPKD